MLTCDEPNFSPRKQIWLSATELFEMDWKGKIIETKNGRSLIEVRDTTNSRAIQDDVYWLEANLRMKQGQFKESILLLEKTFMNAIKVVIFRTIHINFRLIFSPIYHCTLVSKSHNLR